MSDDQIFDNQTRNEMPVDFLKPDPKWKQVLKHNKIVIASIIALIFIGGIGWYFFSNNSAPTNPTSTNVVLQIKGPTQITSGNEGEYTIIYRNGENADLVNVSLEVFYPNGFKFKSASRATSSTLGNAFNLPIVKQGSDGQIVIRGKLSGSTGEDKEIKARLHYRLSNFNSEFAVEQSIHTSILPPDLTMDINGPVQVVSGQDTTFTVTVTNVTQQDFDNLALKLTYPDGFGYTSANPQASKDNNYWKLSKLTSGSSVSIEITGSFTGDANSDLLTRADLGQIINNNFALQISSTATFQVIPSSVSIKISSTSNNYVKLGETINYKVEYANQGPIPLSNLVITVTLNGTALDLSHLSAQNAIVTGNTLTWKAATDSNLSLLSPNERGEVNFTVPVRQILTTNLKNQVIVASANIKSDEISKLTRTPDLSLKLISALGLDVTGDYVSGVVPMQVDQTTIFAMTFVLSNLSNDLSGTDVIASLPLPSSAWNNVIIPQSESTRLSFDPNSGKIRWHLGDVPAFTGRFTPALKVTFQLVVTPTEVNRGKTMPLLKDIQATGTDTFVNQTIQTQNISNVDTGSIDDDVLNTKGSTVQ